MGIIIGSIGGWIAYRLHYPSLFNLYPDPAIPNMRMKCAVSVQEFIHERNALRVTHYVDYEKRAINFQKYRPHWVEDFILWGFLQTIIPLLVSFGILLLPLFPATTSFSTANISYLVLYLPILSILSPLTLYSWFSHFTTIVTRSVIPILGVIGMVELVAIIPMIFNRFPIPFTVPLAIEVSWITIFSFLIYLVPLPKLSQYYITFREYSSNFLKFWVFSVIQVSFYVVSTFYILAFALPSAGLVQIGAYLLYLFVTWVFRKILFEMSNSPLSLYWIQFTSEAFIAIAFPFYANFWLFLLFFFIDSILIGFTVLRLKGAWWEVRAWGIKKLYSHFPFLATANSFFWVSTHESVLQILVSGMGISNAISVSKRKYLEYQIYFLWTTFVSKIITPIIILTIALFLRYGWNSAFYPYAQVPLSNFHLAIIFAFVYIVAYAFLFAWVDIIIQHHFGIKMFAYCSHLFRRQFWFILFCNITAFLLPFLLLLSQNGIWNFITSRVPNTILP